MTAGGALTVDGRLVIDSRVEPGRIVIEDGRIAAIEKDEAFAEGPLVAPGFIDVHVHGWGGHDAMGGRAALDGMARGLLRQGVTTFLPTAVTAPLDDIAAFAETVRAWLPTAPTDGAAAAGFNLEGPFLSVERKGAHNARWLVAPADVDDPTVFERLVDGLRVITIAPELPGSLELIRRLAARGVVVSLGHSAATYLQASAGYAAGARSTTHLFNAMTGVEHRSPGLAVASLTTDAAYTELIADGNHVDPAVWPIVTRAKPSDRLLLVSDALPLAGTGDGRITIGGLEIEVRDGLATLAGSSTLAGSVIALDTAVRNVVRNGTSLPAAVMAASSNPAALLGLADRGRIAVGLRADLVELEADLTTRRVMREGRWVS